MKFNIISEEQINKIYPNNYDCRVLKSYSLMNVNLNTTFRYYYSFYRYHLEMYLLNKLSLKELDNKIKSMHFETNYNGIYKEISNLNLETVFIRNNIFLDRLNETEFKNFENIYKENNDMTIFIENTYKKLIMFDKNISKEKIVNYDPLYGSLLTNNNALIIGLMSKNSKELDEYVKMKEKEYSNILNIPVKIQIFENSENENIFYIKNLYLDEEEQNKDILKKYPKFLPLGSIVTLKAGWKKLMIIGYSQINMDDKNNIYDYIACLYPEGIIKTDYNILFNHEDIKSITAIGMQDEEQQMFMKKTDLFIDNDKKKEILNKVKEQ